MRRALLLLLLLIAPTLAAAQDDDDRSRIVRFLEDQLSDGARDVRIEGFRGALSSTARMDRMTIADADGVWLTLEGAELNWSRAALLRGRLQVNTLTADRLEVARPPVAEAGLDLPQAEATPFALPDLPVSIRIDEVAIDRVTLGPAILGEAVDLSVEGTVRLADGEGAAVIELLRLDGPRGAFDIDVAYANETRQLDVDILFEEDPGGIVANALDLPGEPSLRLSAQGSGSIDRFAAEIALESDGAPRLTGTIGTELGDEDGVRRVSADVQGDVTPLFLPEYREFFGPDVALTTRLRLMPDGAVALDTLDLRAKELTLSGDLALAPGGQPERFDLTARIADPDGEGSVRLPLPETEVTIGAADVVLRYDASDGDSYTAEALVTALETADLSAERLRLDLGGRIADTAQGIAVSSPVAFEIEGLAHDDPDLARALGPAFDLTAQLSWLEGAPLVLSDLAVVSGDLALTGGAALSYGEARLDLTTDLAAEIGDLTRFAALAGQPVAGSLSADLTAEAELLSGAFDLVLTGSGTDLRLSDALPAQLLAGETSLTLSALRNEAGLTLRDLSLDGAQLALDGSGRINSGGAMVDIDARLANIGLFTDALSGPVTAAADATRGPGEDAPWRLNSSVSSGAGITANLSGSVAADAGTADLRATGQLPLALANRALQPRSVFGTLSFDLALSGPPALQSLSGSFRTSGARVTLPNVQTALEGISASGRLSAGRVRFDASGALASGGTVSASGGVGIASATLPAEIDLSAQDLRLVDPTLYEARIRRAEIALRGGLAGAMQVTGDVRLGESEIRLPESGLGGAAPIPPITHFGETPPERRTRIAAGLGPAPSGPGGGGSQRIGLDVTITAPGRIFIRGRGLDAELGGRLRIGGTSANVLPSGRFDLIRGRFSILGTRLDLAEGSATLQGNFDPILNLRAVTRAGEYQIAIELGGPVTEPDIGLSSSPTLPEDEILAQLLFGRSVSALSPIQLLRMADAAATLAGGGGGGGGLFSNLREGLGLDDLDLQTDSEGNAALRAGRYLSDNVYSDVTIGGDGDADLSLNIDLTPNVTARGTFASDGESSVGIFYERDY